MKCCRFGSLRASWQLPNRRMSTFSSRVAPALILLVCSVSSVRLTAGEKNELSAARLINTVSVLASDDMEGRGAGTKGIDAAAQYIADQFEEMGLRTDVFDGTAFQVFSSPAPPELGAKEENRLTFQGPTAGDAASSVGCELGKDFNTLAAGGSGSARGPLVFVGYGITAPAWKYDDYADMDVQGKIVVMLRKEPQQGDATSVFNGLQPSVHASFREKIKNARDHGAAAVIIVNDGYDIQRRRSQQQKSWRHALDKFKRLATWSDDTVKPIQAKLADLAQSVVQLRQTADLDADELVDFRDAGGPGEGAAIPVFFCRRSVLDPVIQRALGTDLATLEQQIDRGPAPRSRALEGWKAECQASIVQVNHLLKNVVGVLEGTGALADETIVIGAHYDHLGRGGSPGGGEIHNGADDNASGTAGVIEVARRLIRNDEPSRRRLVFVAFAGEELGLLGSAQYAKEPPFPLDKTVAMINLDMIGRLRDGKLTIGGTASATEFDAMIEELNTTYQFKIARMPNGQGPSDHAAFYRQKVPVLFFFTDVHDDYHRPTDDADKINVDGMLSVTDFVTDVVRRLDDAAQRPTYRETVHPRRGGRDSARPYLGCVPDASQSTEGVSLLSVAPESPAEKAGLRTADVLVKFGEADIRSLADLDRALRNHKSGEEVAVIARRGREAIPLTVTLGEPR
jgi:hypothetical protein